MRLRLGLSLMETMLVIALSGFVVSLGYDFYQSAMHDINRHNVMNVAEKVKIAVADYYGAYGHLPCPASLNKNKGEVFVDCEDITYTANNVTRYDNDGIVTYGHMLRGGVPYAALNLSESASMDLKGYKIDYIVDYRYTQYDATAVANPLSITGSLIIEDEKGNVLVGSDEGGGVIAVLKAHGSDYGGAFNRDGRAVMSCDSKADNIKNCDPAVGKGHFVYFDPRRHNKKGGFKDYITWITRDVVTIDNAER